MVKSAYYVTMEQSLANAQGTDQTVPSNARQASWDFLWKQRIPNKIKVFIWQFCLKALPTNENLWRRKIKPNNLCDV